MTATSLIDPGSFVTLADNLDHPEGVAWGTDGYVYAGGEAGQIYRIHLEKGEKAEIANTGGFILGLCLDAHHNIYACDVRHRAVMRITQDGTVTTYSNGTSQRKMVNPNYPVFDRTGTLYVSDSGSWHGDNGCLFRIHPGGAAEIVSTAVKAFPNGMALHPDGRTLYIAMSTLPGVMKISLHDNGSVSAPELVVEMPRTIPDGLAFDAEHNLYISCYTPDTIYRLAPDGEMQVLVDDWESTAISSPANIAFAGDDLRTLVVSSLSRWHLAKAVMPVAGYPLHYPQID